MKNDNIKIGIFSSAIEKVSKENIILAENITKYLYELNLIAVTGGSVGIPSIVISKMHELGGETVLFSPDIDETKHETRKDNHSVSQFNIKHFFTGFTERSLAMIHEIDGAIVLNGRIGTLSEFTICLEENIPVAVIRNTGGISDHLEDILVIAEKEFKQDIIFEENYKEAINKLIKSIKDSKK